MKKKRHPKGSASRLLPVLLAAALLAGCTASQIEDFLYAGGKITYDSLRARQPSE